ncbi:MULTISPECIES: 7-cyano-7-deazaguanine synthase [Nocardiopsis]|jgi:7-cyano-7-deazaguanine synthase|uniref:7-cyano-7-deazaguanine synthase n=1 Tax=Nocardiopsis tropica TaxID=109330 RepID=A0ABU7KKT8_9ACTN|nr:7-cyano-7-deazaguanine synthase [Nocardiopsis umidischolae]MEE2049762.1 7-cyano-7-deazaguanine synthase [Nocardiopsis umidischolae]
MSDLVLLSGGMDSATALALSAQEGRAGAVLNINYSQRNAAEIQSARSLAEHYGVDYHFVDLSSWGAKLRSSFTDPTIDVPSGPYSNGVYGDGGADSTGVTVVPSRNGTFVFAALGIAQTLGHDRVVTAVHADDHDVYPDTRPEFIAAVNTAALLSTSGTVTVHTPFSRTSKAGIGKIGRSLGVPYELTWSCYSAGPSHCGTCGTCILRHDALTAGGHTDPTVYAVVPELV